MTAHRLPITDPTGELIGYAMIRDEEVEMLAADPDGWGLCAVYKRQIDKPNVILGLQVTLIPAEPARDES